MQPVTIDDIEAVIASEHYFTASQGKAGAKYVIHDANDKGPLSLLTFCVLMTKNGHTVTGESYCQDPAKFSTEEGRRWARKAAIDKLWPMVVYARRELAAGDPCDQAAADGVESDA